MPADGRVRLTDAPGRLCIRRPNQVTFTGEGTWVISRHSDEYPGIRILIEFPVDGTPAVQACDGWFTLHGTGKGGTEGDGSDVSARFLSDGRGARETFRRTATG